MSSNKNTIYVAVFLVFILLALAGWFVIRGQSNMPLSPSMPHNGDSGFSPIDEKRQESADTTSAIAILEPVPGGAGHDAQGWKKVKGNVPVVVQTAGEVSKIVFYLDRNLVAEVEGPAFDFELDTAKYTDCMYLLLAKAYNSEGSELGEARSQIWIDNTPTNCM